MKHSTLFIGLLLVLCGSSTGISFAQPSYPNHPLQLIITNVAGAQQDIISRAVAAELEKILGQPVIPVNKPGAATTLGTDILAKSKKDGYTIGYTSNAAMVYARIINPETIHYDVDKDLEPLALHVFTPLGIAVQEGSPWKTFAELVDYAKKNPGKLRVSTVGIGSVPHFDLELIQSLTDAQFTHIPFKGGESVMTAVLGGHVEVTIDMMSKIIPNVEAKKMRALLVTNKMADYPNVPTITELGYKQDLFALWFAFYTQSGIPEGARKLLVSALEKAIKIPELKARIEKMDVVVDYRSPAQVKKQIAEEYEQVMAVANKTGLIKK